MKHVNTNRGSNTSNNHCQQVVEGELLNSKSIKGNRVQLFVQSKLEDIATPIDTSALMLYLNSEEYITNRSNEYNTISEAMDDMYALCSSVNHFQNKPDFSRPTHQIRTIEVQAENSVNGNNIVLR